MLKWIPLPVAAGALALGVMAHADTMASPTKQSNAGDSMSQAFGANGVPWDHPDLSWVQGTSRDVNSVFSRYGDMAPGYSQEPESVTGAELVGGGDNFPAQAARICSQAVRPTRVSVLLGSNDVCNRPRSSSWDATANLYSIETWVDALRAGLDQLASCLPNGAVVQVMSIPRLDFLYDAGHDKSLWCYIGVWPMAGVCRIVTGERNAGRRAQIGARVDAYNHATADEVAAYDTNANGRNPRGLYFMTDWKGSIAEGQSETSIGTYRFTADDINGVDCFHPNTWGQSKIACLGWATGAAGDSSQRSVCMHGGF